MTASAASLPGQLDILDAVYEHSDEWWKQTAWQAVEHLIATGREFQIYDVTTLGCPEPADPRSQWGALGSRLSRRANTVGDVVYVRHERGRRRTVNGSAVAVWRRA